MTLEQGQILNSRYRIDELLGHGGFGAVYKAWDLSLERACAVKENMETAENNRRQFAREATVLASLSHPNLPRVTDHFQIPNQGQYLVMDFVEGMDLGQLVSSQGPLPTARALDIIGQVANALVYLHTRKPPVLHRDIKPANIKITPDGQAVLVDFGLVKMYSPQMETTIGARAVTPGYSPPEQYGQGTTDPRSDIYSLAATLYTLLTGQKPQESVQRYGIDSLQAAHQVNPLVPASVSAVVSRAMNLSPTQRYQTVEDLRLALPPAAPARPRSRAGWWWMLGGAAGLLLCLVLGGAVLGGFFALPLLFGTSTPAPATAAPAAETPTEAAIEITDTPESPTELPPAEILFQDDFSDASGGWIIDFRDKSTRKYEDGQYVVQITAKNWVVWATASTGAMSDVHVELTAASTGLANDEGFGLVCGFRDNANFYYMGFTPEGYYAIIKSEDNKDTVLTDSGGKWIQSMRIARRAESYRVGADCRSDGTLTLFVDGLDVATVTDTTFPDGGIGLFARTFDLAPAELRFDDLVVTALQ